MKHLTYILTSTMIASTLATLSSFAQSTYEPYTFTTLAGRSPFSNPDGTGSTARFRNPSSVAVDSAGNVYVADTDAEHENTTIRKVTPAGVVTTLAGLVVSARAIDTAGNLYLILGSSIQKATLVGSNWVVMTLAGLADVQGSEDGTGSTARLHNHWGL